MVSLPEARMGATVRQNRQPGKVQASTSRRYAQTELTTAQSWVIHRTEEVFAHWDALGLIFLRFGARWVFQGCPRLGNGDFPD